MQIPPISRIKFLGTTMMGGLSACFQSLFDNNNINNPNDNNIANNLPPITRAYHEPPPGTADYSDNPTVFGKILNGDLPCGVYQESTELLAFRDKSPKARLHALVIPKRFVQNVYSLTPDDLNLVLSMREMGLELLQKEEPNAFATEDYILCFHIPPFNSVDHLHLHVLSPASEMNWIYRNGKYNCGMRWCTSDLDVIGRLEGGKVAVPYKQLF